MDVLKPPLLWIEGRCYRTIPVTVDPMNSPPTSTSTSTPTPTPTDRMSVEKDCTGFEVNGSYNDDEPDDMTGDVIDEDEDGRFEITSEIPAAIAGIVIGSKGSTLMQIQSETGTSITVPKQCEGPTVIKGPTRESVKRAFDRIQHLIVIARSRLSFTHFLSLPLTGDTILDSSRKFQQDILESCKPDQRISAVLFQNPAKIHLTIGMMVLLSEKERKNAAELLQDCGNTVIMSALQNRPLTIKVKGLEIMNDDPSDVDVLYAKVSSSDGSNRLQLLVDLLVEKFVSAGLINMRRDQVKLHATLMNTRFALRDDDNSHRNSQKKRPTFDARQILADFGGFDFGEQKIDTVHLSIRHKFDASGFYKASSKLQLNPQSSIIDSKDVSERTNTTTGEANLSLDIRRLSDNKTFELKINVPENRCGLIVGYKGSTRMKIEEETNTRIWVPRHKKGPTVVQGGSEHDVEEAYLKIMKLLKYRPASKETDNKH